MDRQILLYDTRTAGFDRAPCLEFGFRDTSTQRKTRYTKGSTCHNYVVRPYGDTEKGVIKMWDYRNAKVSGRRRMAFQMSDPSCRT